MFKRSGVFLASLLAMAALWVCVGPAEQAHSASPGASQKYALAPLDTEVLRYQLALSPCLLRGDRVGLGMVPTPIDFSYTCGLSGTGTERSVRSYAARYDLRTLGKVTSVKDQDPYGTCWAFAGMGSLESCLLSGETNDFSEDNLVLTSGFFSGRTGLGRYDGGNDLMTTAYLVRWGGPVYESEDAYGDNSTPAGLAARKHVQEVLWFPMRGSASDNDTVKRAVSTYGGLVASLSWQGSADASSAYYQASTHSYYYNGSATSNHEVLIVGWDDDYAASNFATAPPGNGAFIVKNSWGSGWGDGGYFYVSYYDTVFGRDDLMCVFSNGESTTNYSSIYEHDPLGVVDQVGAGSETLWFANAFTATSSEDLKAVGFYTLAPYTAYEVYTGTSLTDKTLRASGTQSIMGYHTVTLSSAVPLTAGQQFVVAVKVTSPGATYPVAVECPVSTYSSGATAGRGESFVSTDGFAWDDLLDYFAGTNVCLKAYTAAEPADTVPPTTTVSGNDGLWHRSAVSLTFIVTDNDGGSGMSGGSAKTEYQIDAGSWTAGTSVTIPAAADHSNDGAHVVNYRSVDAAGNSESAKTTTVGIDTAMPTSTGANNVTVRRGRNAVLTFRIADPAPSCGRAAVTIAIRRASTVVKTIKLTNVPTNTARSSSFRVSLAKGSYTWTVKATDIAGNVGQASAARKLIVR